MKCFICGKEYDECGIKPVEVLDENGNPMEVRQIKYKGVKYPLCTTCLRLITFSYCLKEHWDIIR